jgi:hypothetical protein
MSQSQRAEKVVIEDPQRQFGSSGEQIFDNRVHIRDASTGRIFKKQHYAMHAFDGIKIWERPINSGNMFNAHGDSIGRWKKIDGGRWEKISAEHSSVPLFEKVLPMEDLATRNAELESELAALKADLEQRTAPTKHHGKA